MMIGDNDSLAQLDRRIEEFQRRVAEERLNLSGSAEILFLLSGTLDAMKAQRAAAEVLARRQAHHQTVNRAS